MVGHEVFTLDIIPDRVHWRGQDTMGPADYELIMGVVPPLSEHELKLAQRALEDAPVQEKADEDSRIEVRVKHGATSDEGRHELRDLGTALMTTTSSPNEAVIGSVLGIPIVVTAPFESVNRPDAPRDVEAYNDDLEDWQEAVTTIVRMAAGLTVKVVEDAVNVYTDRESARNHHARLGVISLRPTRPATE